MLLPPLGDSADKPVAQQIKALVEKAAKIVITGHERPDGDCIGSEVALCSILREAGRNVQVVNADPPPARYQYLNLGGMVRQALPNEQLAADLVFVLDATDLRRLGRLKKEHFGAAQIVNIDHHLFNPNFGHINWVDTKAAATGELIWRLAACCEWKAPFLALQALYTALVTDTGQFSYSNTTPRVLRMAAEMVEHGVDPEALWQRVYLNRSRPELALDARARASLECFAEGRICAIALTHEDFLATGTGPEHTEELAGVPRTLAGVQLALFFYEIDAGRQTKVSVRTNRGLDACALAQKFGGGGHKQAAGCTIPAKLPEAKARFIAEALRMVEAAG